MREMIFNGVKDVLWNIWNWFVSLVELPLTFSMSSILNTVILSIILLASAAWTANIAEDRGRHPYLHFLLGLIIPFIYPLVILFALAPLAGSQHQIKRQEKQKQELAVAQRAAQIAASEKAVADQLAQEEADPTLWSKERLERFAYKSDGSAAGPFICTLSDGQQIRVLAIRDLQAEIAVLELAGDTPGTKGPVMRFPYTRIHGMEIENQA